MKILWNWYADILPQQPETWSSRKSPCGYHKNEVDIEIETRGRQYSLYEFTEGSCFELKASNLLRIYIPQLY